MLVCGCASVLKCVAPVSIAAFVVQAGHDLRRWRPLSIVLCFWQVIDVERYEVVLVSPRNHFMCVVANQCQRPKVFSLSKQRISRVRDPRWEGRERVDAGFTPMLPPLKVLLWQHDARFRASQKEVT